MTDAKADQDQSGATQGVQLRGQQRHARRFDQQNARGRVVQQMQHLARRVAPVDAHAQRAQLEAGVPVLDHLHAVMRQHRAHVTFTYAQPLQSGGQAVGTTVHVAPGAAPVAVDESNLVGQHRAATAQQVTRQDHAALLLRFLSTAAVRTGA